MSRKRLLAAVSMAAVLMVVAAACSSSSSSSTGAGGSPTTGGTYRTATQSFGYTDAFDPTGEYLGNAWGLYGQLLVRGLMTYNHQPANQGGDTPVPDIATGMPQVSSDGLTYTFTLKTDVMFGPPVDRAVTSHDIEYAFERINLASLAAQYGNYYCGVIKGMTCTEKTLHPVSGIETPNNTTIVFHLDQPTGDLLYRLAMPATAAVPQEVAKCFTQAGDYGRDVISSGPYMIYGEDQLNISSCKTIQPISGYDPNKGVTFVRNPNYKASSDSPSIRENYLDGLQIQVDSNVSDIFQKIQNGQLDGSYGDTPPPTVEQYYATTPGQSQYIHADPGDRTWYLTMNLIAPPFDDPHVRAAMNYVLDKAALVKAYGGSLHAVPATTVEPPTVLPATANYDPYPTSGFAGDVQKALAEMKQSHYKTDSSGKCIDPACSGFIFLGRSESPWPNLDQIVVQDMQKIGLNPKLTEVDTSTGYTTLQQVKKLIPVSLVPGWGKDFADPFGFDYFIFDSAGIGCTTAVNYSLVGMSSAQAKQCGVLPQYEAALKNYSDGKLPSIDSMMTQCEPTTGSDRQTCFANMDKYLMTTAIPWVPWGWGNNLMITSPTVTKYVYDSNADTGSFCMIAVNNGLKPVNVG
jgi:peptide/nickel transport system substrate-binding protein